MKAHCLASSSHGNCYVLEFDIDGVPTRIMVECGIPITDIFKKLNNIQIELASIDACLITHAHSDHCKAAKDLNKYMIPCYMSKETKNLLGFGEVLDELKPTAVAPGIKVMAFNVEHDIEGSVGFIIKTKYECVIFVNDHKRWTCNLKKIKPNYVFIECNYDHKVVYAQVTDLKKAIRDTSLSADDYLKAKAKLSQHERNLNAHCSLHGTLVGLKKLNLTQCHTIFLMHLSDRYANEYRMKNEVQNQTQILTYACGKDGGIK